MARSERGLDRLVNFSDATVAIAITLLILPLVEAANDLGTESVVAFAGAHLGLVIAFAVSFYVIGLFWLQHHRFFEAVDDYTHTVLVLNLLWLAGIVFIPFVANAVSVTSGERRDVDLLYIATLLVVAGSLAAIEVVYSRHRELLRSLDALDLLAAGTPVVALVLAGVVSSFVPGGLLWLLLLIPGNVVEGWLRKRWRGRAAT